jgi:hypothetical protein
MTASNDTLTIEARAHQRQFKEKTSLFRPDMAGKERERGRHQRRDG